MPMYHIALPEGPKAIEGRKFAYYVQNVRYWFFVHKNLNNAFGFTVSHLESGMKVRDIDHSTLAACKGQEVDAAKLTIKNLCDKVGEAKVRSVLAGAKPLKERG